MKTLKTLLTTCLPLIIAVTCSNCFEDPINPGFDREPFITIRNSSAINYTYKVISKNSATKIFNLNSMNTTSVPIDMNANQITIEIYFKGNTQRVTFDYALRNVYYHNELGTENTTKVHFKSFALNTSDWTFRQLYTNDANNPVSIDLVPNLLEYIISSEVESNDMKSPLFVIL